MNKLIEKFGMDKRWVNFKFELNKDGKKTKVPYSPITNRKAATTKETDWGTFNQTNQKQYGIIFKPDKKLLGIDIDHCLEDKEIVHIEKDNIIKLLKEANTYTEVSPSGTGLHLFLSITESFDLEGSRDSSFPYEFYNHGRYFTVTQVPFNEEKEVRIITPEEAISILKITGYPWNKVEKTVIIKQQAPLDLDDQTVLEKMFNSKNGEKLRSLYNYIGEDTSAKDMAFLSSLAFWTGRNSIQMERIWMSSLIGSRKKTQDRKDYRDRTINKAITDCKEIYNTPKMKQEKVNKELDLNLLFIINKEKDKVFIQNTENICRILRKHPDFQGKLRYDVFKNTLEIFKKDKWFGIEDNDSVHYQTLIQILFPCFAKVGKEMVYDAIIKVAKENTVDSASDYIRSLRWDGQDRLDTWLVQTYGTPNDIYHKAVGSNWLKGLVKRITEPGCKFDYVLVLEGEQGTKKSTSLYVLGGSWHVETAMSTDSKDFFMQFAGKAIVEFSEGETLSRTEVKRMKAIITMQTDKYRPPYERSSQEFPRRCVFAMTTNQTEYLKDETGNRRWLPVTVVLPEANVEWLAANRDQLFAEAYHRVANLKEKVYEFPKEEMLAAQEQRRIHDANTDLIADWYFNTLTDSQRNAGITVQQVFKDALHGGFAGKPLTKYDEMTIGAVLKDALKLTKDRVNSGGTRCTKWFNPSGKTIEQEVEVEDGNKVLSSW